MLKKIINKKYRVYPAVSISFEFLFLEDMPLRIIKDLQTLPYTQERFSTHFGPIVNGMFWLKLR